MDRSQQTLKDFLHLFLSLWEEYDRSPVLLKLLKEWQGRETEFCESLLSLKVGSDHSAWEKELKRRFQNMFQTVVDNDVEHIIHIDTKQYGNNLDEKTEHSNALFCERDEQRASPGPRGGALLFVCVDVTNFFRFLLSSRAGDHRRQCDIARTFWDPAIQLLTNDGRVPYCSPGGSGAFLQFAIRLQPESGLEELALLTLNLIRQLKDALEKALPRCEPQFFQFRIAVSGAPFFLDDNFPPTGFGVWQAAKIVKAKHFFSSSGDCPHHKQCVSNICKYVKPSRRPMSATIIMDRWANEMLLPQDKESNEFCNNEDAIGFPGAIYRMEIGLGFSEHSLHLQ